MRRVLIWLIGLFPAAFRDQFRADVADQIRRDGAKAAQSGWWSGLKFAVGTAANLVFMALAEHWNPMWQTDVSSPVSRKGRRSLVNDWTTDLRHALRSLARAPGFLVIAVGTLGLAMGAVTGIFTVVDAVLLRPLPYPEPERLVYIAATAPGSDLPDEFGVSAEFFVEYSEESKLLAGVSTYNSGTATLRVGDRAERIRMSFPSLSLFTTLGITPIIGRLPLAEEENRVAVISHALWATWFGADPAVIGQTYDMAGASRTIVGVMPADFRFPRDDVMLWIPNVIRATGITPGRFGIPLVGRLADGATEEALAAELSRLAHRLPERFGGPPAYARMIEQHRPVVRSLREELIGDIARPLWVLLGSVGIVLLIACANVANLLMVRTERRQQDLAIRRAIGAGRGHLIRSQLAEILVVALAAGTLAAIIAWAAVPLFVRVAPEGVPRLGDAGLSVTGVAFTAFVALFAALLCGMLPAIRSSAPNLARLRDGTRGSTRRRSWGRDGLVVAQTALALVLLIGSGLMIRSFRALRNVDPGYDTDDIFTFQIAAESPELNDAPSYARFDLAFMDRLAALPGVESAGIIENVPLDESTASGRFRTEAMTGDEAGALLNITFTAGDYYRTMGISVLAGRAFNRDEHEINPGRIVLSQSAAETLWPGQNAIGRRLQLGTTWHEVIGVVEDVRQNGFRETPQSLVYFPLAPPPDVGWTPTSPAFVIRTGRAASIAPEIRDLVREVAPGAPMYRAYTMDFLAARSMLPLSFTMMTLAVAAGLALLLGTIGLYGVLSYVVAERTREIGVRMALGARAAQVRRMVVAQGARVVIIGVAIGLIAAQACSRLLAGLLFEVDAADALTSVAMSGALILVGLLASYIPARRASSVDPNVTLRES